MSGEAELPAVLYDAAATRALDRHAIEVAGIAGFDLMQRAGRAAFDALRAEWPQARRLAIVCGTGNNGGDGFVIAALARADGFEVDIELVGATERITGDAALARDLAASGGVVPTSRGEALAARLAAADVIVDALFGTGLDREVAGRQADVIAAINAAPRPVLAIDVPSGLDASSGRSLGCAVEAQCTVTFIGLKQGLYTGDGPAHAGRIVYADLDLAPACLAAVAPTARRIDYATIAHAFGPRRRTAHKGDFGHVLVVGGAPGFAGAARLAGEAALRVGAGLVSLATHPAHAASVTAARPELMCHGVADGAALRPLLARASVVALGPGLGQGEWGRALFAVARDCAVPVVFDADGLNLLAADPDLRAGRVLTPHPGEAARLLGTGTAAIARDRFAAARALTARYGGPVLLKGAGTIVHSDGDLPAVVAGGNPGMASGGMGDVLCGVIAALLAQGHAPPEAATLGACLHAEAADRAAATGGERGLLAGDLMPWLRTVVNPPR
ncbi:MAG: NAD(P)H-hydrate dehydratase [Gammaproteobacteria bacterium]